MGLKEVLTMIYLDLSLMSRFTMMILLIQMQTTLVLKRNTTIPMDLLDHQVQQFSHLMLKIVEFELI